MSTLLAQFPSGGGGGASGSVSVTGGSIEIQGRNPSVALQSLQLDASGNLKVAGSTATADCVLSYSAPSGTSGSSTSFDNRNNSATVSSCRYWVLVWQHPNTTATTVSLQIAPDAGGSPGAFVSTGLTANAGSQVTAETSGYGSAILSGYAPWARISYTAAIATVLEAKLFGWRVAPSEIFQSASAPVGVAPDCQFLYTGTGTGAGQTSVEYSNALQTSTDQRGCTFWRLSYAGSNNVGNYTAQVDGRTATGTTISGGAFYALDGSGQPLLASVPVGESRFIDFASGNLQGMYALRIAHTHPNGTPFSFRIDGWRNPPFPVVRDSVTGEFRYTPANQSNLKVQVTGAATASSGNNLLLPVAGASATDTVSVASYPVVSAYIQLTGTGTISGGVYVMEGSNDSAGPFTTILLRDETNGTFAGNTAAATGTRFYSADVSFRYVRLRLISNVTGGGTLQAKVTYLPTVRNELSNGSLFQGLNGSSVPTPVRTDVAGNMIVVDPAAISNSQAISLADSSVSTTTGAGGQTLLTGSPDPGSQAVLALSSQSGSVKYAGLTVSGTWVGTLQVEGTYDGTVYTPVNILQAGVPDVTPTQTLTGNTVAQVYVQGMQAIRIRATAFTSGTASVTWNATQGSSAPPAPNIPVSANRVQVQLPSESDTLTAASITAVDVASTTVTVANGQTLVTGVPTANSFVGYTINRMQTARVQATGTFVATLQVETSADNGVTWTGSAVQQTNYATPSSTFTGPFIGYVNVIGATNIRVRETAFTSGTPPQIQIKSSVTPFSTAIPGGALPTTDLSNGPVTPGTSATQSSLQGVQYNATLPQLTNAQQSAMQADLFGRVAQGVSDVLVNGAATSAAGNNVLLPSAGTTPVDTLQSAFSIRVQLTGAVGITTPGTVLFESSVDGTRWVPATMYQEGTGNATPITSAVDVSASQSRIYFGNVHGRFIRARIVVAPVGGNVSASTKYSATALPIPVETQTTSEGLITDNPLSLTMSALNSNVAWSLKGNSYYALTLTNLPAATTSWVGVVTFQISTDGGSSWLNYTLPSRGGPTDPAASSTNKNGVWTVYAPTSSGTVFRVVMTSYTSGTVVALLTPITRNMKISVPWSPTVIANTNLTPVLDATGMSELTVQISAISGVTYSVQGTNDPTLTTWLAVPTNVVGSSVGAAFVMNGVNTFRANVMGMRWIRIRCIVAGASAAIQGITATYGQTIQLSSAGNDMFVPLVNTVTTVTTVSSVTSAALSAVATTDIASAAITTTATSAAIAMTNVQSASFGVSITAATGTNLTLDIVIQCQVTTGATEWFDIYHFERATAVGFLQSPNLNIPCQNIRYVRTVAGTTPSFTMSLVRMSRQTTRTNTRAFFNRTIDLNTLNSVTSSYVIQSCDAITIGVSVGAATTPAQLQVEVSPDGSNWFAFGTPVTATASTNTLILNDPIETKFVRVRVSTAGSGAVLNYISIQGK